MAARVIMPALGIAQETGLITQWLKEEGDMVTEGEPLLEIETDKTTAVLEAEASGILTHLTAFDGDEVPIAATIAWILAPGEALPAAVDEKPQVTAVVDQPSSLAATTTALPPVSATAVPVTATPLAGRIAQEHGIDLSLVNPTGGKITKEDVLAYLNAQESAIQTEGVPARANGAKLLPASPKARRLAADKGIDIKHLTGTGPEGAVLTADVLAYRSPKLPATPSESPRILAPSEISQAWRVMALRLSESWQTVPHFYLTREVQASQLLVWQAAAQKRTDEKVTITDLLLKATAVALRAHPRVNASWIDEDIHYNEAINISLAVATDDGLMVPVIHQTDLLNVAEIAAARHAVVSRTLAGKLKVQDLQGGTFTLSNLGMFGIDAFNAIVNPPQAAILAVGRIAERVVPVAGEVQIQPMMTLTLSLDHRVVDGARGAQFLDTLTTYLEQPLTII